MVAVNRMSQSSPLPRWLGHAALLLLATGAGALALTHTQPEPFDPATDLASLCTSAKPFTVEALGAPRHRFGIAVPAVNPLPGQGDARSYAVSRGDIIELRIDSPRAGAVAMHGILEEHQVRPTGAVFVRLQVKYSGRFPLHFHGADGAHFEVAVFEVR
jgi:hypothetical protein